MVGLGLDTVTGALSLHVCPSLVPTPFPTGTGGLVTLAGGYGTMLGCATSLRGGVGGGPVVLSILPRSCTRLRRTVCPLSVSHNSLAQKLASQQSLGLSGQTADPGTELSDQG